MDVNTENVGLKITTGSNERIMNNTSGAEVDLNISLPTVNNTSGYDNATQFSFINLLNGLLLVMSNIATYIASYPITLCLFTFSICVSGLVLILGRRRKDRIRRHSVLLSGDSRNIACARSVTIGFFHPYCNAGGGGERVLWCAIRSLQNRYDFVKCVVYTGDTDASPIQILKRAKERFNIDLKRDVHFVYLHKRVWVTSDRYPVFTLLGQSLGSVVLGLEALWNFTPDVFIDTMGYAFILPLFKIFGGCKTACYVHYPTISTDMIMKVDSRKEDFNNAGRITRSMILSYGKLMYYKIFAYMYGVVGRCSDVVMVNSTWTQNHVNSLWKIPQRTSIVYPPCDTKSLLELLVDEDESCKSLPRSVLSIGQFRPEKNHKLQLQAFKLFRDKCPRNLRDGFQLVMVGSCRDKEDEIRVEQLITEARRLKINKFVKICVNVPFDELLTHLLKSTIGIHTMTDEHFGIGIVEFMAAGVIPLAHNSGGPQLDIVIEWEGGKTGYLANSVDEYATAMLKIFNKSPKEKFALAINARECVKKRFSEESFKKRFLSETEFLLK